MLAPSGQAQTSFTQALVTSTYAASPMFCTAEKIAQPVCGKVRSREEGIKRTGQRQNWDGHLYCLHNTWTLRRSSLGEGAVRRGEHSYPQRELTQEQRVLTVPQAPEDSGAGVFANKEPCYIAKAGKKVSTHGCKVNSRKQSGVWRQQSVCKGLKNEWVEGNERFKTFGSRLMKWREKGPGAVARSGVLHSSSFFKRWYHPIMLLPSLEPLTSCSPHQKDQRNMDHSALPD